MRPSLVGKTLAGRFRLVERLGEGAMGEVYVAEHETLRRKFAIKVLKDTVQTDEVVMERFRREALAASSLNHPNIVFISDFGQTDDDALFLVMEYTDDPRERTR